MRPIDPDEFVDSLDFADRQMYCRSWGKLVLKGTVECVTDRLFDAAFEALAELNLVPTTEPDRFLDGCVCGILRVIRQGITERSSDAKYLVGRLADFCLSDNCSVAAGVIREFEPQSGFPGDLTSEAFNEVAIPKLRMAAIQERAKCQTAAMSVTGLAFHVLCQLDERVLMWEELQSSRLECAAAYRQWAENAEPSKAQLWLARANALTKE